MKKAKFTIYLATLMGLTLSCQTAPIYNQVYTTPENSWVSEVVPTTSGDNSVETIIINTNDTKHEIEGFGACFNELGWTSLSLLSQSDRDSIIKELFLPNYGANFTICRMPLGANDFSRDWYSYNETEGDFEMKTFSIDNDKETLIPFIKSALTQNKNLQIWASPWSPPSWMKHNKHYASRSFIMEGEDIYGKKDFGNGLPKDRQGYEGTDMFIQQEKYLAAYALYFQKFITSYKEQGINIFGVMPQNEFNSAQVFPSCCWTAKGLANFIGGYLGEAMEEVGVEVMFGTMERKNYKLVDTILQDSKAKNYIKGVGFQWAGKDAIADIHRLYPNMRLIQSEQECGNGKNTWDGLLSSWNLMKHYIDNGTSIYDYWNLSLTEGGVSRWGWRQNSLVVVDPADNSFKFTYEYYLMKHFSHFIQQGAKYIADSGSLEDAMAFKNPDGSIIVICLENSGTDRSVAVNIDDKTYNVTLKANSVNTFSF